MWAEGQLVQPEPQLSGDVGRWGGGSVTHVDLTLPSREEEQLFLQEGGVTLWVPVGQ